jgi:hypothetical protein
LFVGCARVGQAAGIAYFEGKFSKKRSGGGGQVLSHNPAVTDLLLTPYLPLSKEMTIREWRLVPFKEMREDETVPRALAKRVERLVAAYGRDDGMGALVHLIGQQVGAEFEMRDFMRLRAALLAGTVGGNPDMASAENGGLGGWSLTTSENALLVGHPIGDGSGYALQIGVLFRVLSGRGALEDEPLPPIEPPVELPTPLISSFDVELAEAVYDALGADDDRARRLQRALDWYRVVLSNAEAVSIDVRIGAAKSALEVLLGVGDETKKIVRAFGRLVRKPDSTAQTYEDVFWANGPVRLTEDEWWLTRLSMLRNAIMHGDEVPDDLWKHEGHHQLNLVHDNLLAALRAFAAESAGDDLLALSPPDRDIARRHAEMVKAIEAMQTEQGAI